MAQIQKGTTYATGNSVTAANLNAHVDSAVLLPGAIIEQTSAPAVTSTNQILTTDGIGLYKTTLASIISPLNLFDKSQAQTLGQNVTMASGADIALSSGSIMSLSSGAQIALSSGALLTLGQDPIAALEAVPKQYVDSKFLSLATGGLVSGSISMIGTSSVLTLSADPLTALSAAPKQYVDNRISREVASLRFRSTTNPGTANTLVTSSNIVCSVNQSAGSSTATIAVANPALFNTSFPFFLTGQYIGIATAVGGLTAKLYEITSVNYSANTFTITAPDPTAKTGSTQLSFVYSNLTPPALPSRLDANGNRNIKSVALCLTSRKHYINYWYDSESDDMATTPTTTAGNPALLTTHLFGDAITNTGTATAVQFMTALQMRNINTTVNTVANITAPGSPVGFGLTSKGINVGFFVDATTGLPYTNVHDANVTVLR